MNNTWTKSRLIALASRIAGRPLGPYQAARLLMERLEVPNLQSIYGWYRGRYGPCGQRAYRLAQLEQQYPEVKSE